MKIININNVSKVYQNGVNALDTVSFDVEKGDFFALLGPNGAGKSTLIGILTSLVRKSHGSVKIAGIDIDKEPSKAKQHIGVVPQEFNFNIFEKVINIIVNQAGYYGIPRSEAKDRAEFYLNQLELWSKKDEIARSLSGGMKRRMMIARALVHQPEILILDEPTAGVDIEIRRSMWRFMREINEQGVTIILTTHYLEEAESLCRNIAFIDHGRIIAHSSMQEFLSKLETESFILYLADPLGELPLVENFSMRLIDSKTIEIDLANSQNIVDLFIQLKNHGIVVSSMRNKSNRLEELFVQLTHSER